MSLNYTKTRISLTYIILKLTVIFIAMSITYLDQLFTIKGNTRLIPGGYQVRRGYHAYYTYVQKNVDALRIGVFGS